MPRERQLRAVVLGDTGAEGYPHTPRQISASKRIGPNGPWTPAGSRLEG